MCGFVGYVNQTDIPDNTIEKMADRIRHRGPDDEAYFADEGPAMGVPSPFDHRLGSWKATNV